MSDEDLRNAANAAMLLDQEIDRRVAIALKRIFDGATTTSDGSAAIMAVTSRVMLNAAYDHNFQQAVTAVLKNKLGG
jgi:hypothetical protein